MSSFFRLNDIIDVVNNGVKPLTAEEHASIQVLKYAAIFVADKSRTFRQEPKTGLH